MANIIISPSKYVQGKGELANIAQYATKLGKKPFILISEGGKKRVGGIIEDSFKDTGCELVFEAFHGECSKNEINRLVAIVKEKGCDLVIGVGGGKIFPIQRIHVPLDALIAFLAADTHHFVVVFAIRRPEKRRRLACNGLHQIATSFQLLANLRVGEL